MTLALHRAQFPRRSPVLGLIILMHAALVYVVNSGIRFDLPSIEPPLTLVDIAPLPRMPVQQPIPPKPEHPALRPPIPLPIPPQLPLPDEVSNPSMADNPPIFTEGLGPPVEPAVQAVSPGLDPRHPIGMPRYPSQSIRMNEQGLVRVNVCVQPDGRLSEVLLAASSGFARLDTAAVNHLRKPGVRLRPGTRNGQAVEMCTEIPVRFDIENR